MGKKGSESARNADNRPMSKKHYIQIAASFARRMEVANEAFANPIYAAAYRNALRDMAEDLCDVMRVDNPRFDKEKFLTAANCQPTN